MEFKREYFLFFLSPLFLVVIGVGMLQIITQKGRVVGPDSRKEDLLLQEVMDLVDHEYVIEPDATDLTYGAAKGIARSLDRYCRVYRKDEWERRKQRAQLGVVARTERDRANRCWLKALDQLGGEHRLSHKVHAKPLSLCLHDDYVLALECHF